MSCLWTRFLYGSLLILYRDLGILIEQINEQMNEDTNRILKLDLRGFKDAGSIDKDVVNEL